MQEAMQSSASSLKNATLQLMTFEPQKHTVSGKINWGKQKDERSEEKIWSREEFQMIYGFDRRAAEYYVALRQSRWCVFIASQWIRVDKMTT